MPELELAVGEARRLELPGRGSAGYSWRAEVEGPEGVVQVRRAPSGPAPPAPVASGGPPPASGSAPAVFELVGLAEGRMLVRLTLRRPFAEDEPPLEEVDLDVTVTAVPLSAG